MFGPSKDDVWQQFASEIGAEFISGGIKDGWYAGESKLIFHHRGWSISLDTYQDTMFSLANDHTLQEMFTRGNPYYTRLRSQYISKDGFCFSIHHKSLIGKLIEAVGFKHTETGFENFDSEFVVKGNDENKIKELLSVSRIRYLLSKINNFQLMGTDAREGILGNDLPKDVHELRFRFQGLVTDTQELRSFLDLFVELLEQLYKMGSAAETTHS
jgi:hypothetical protein